MDDQFYTECFDSRQANRYAGTPHFTWSSISSRKDSFLSVFLSAFLHLVFPLLPPGQQSFNLQPLPSPFLKSSSLEFVFRSFRNREKISGYGGFARHAEAAVENWKYSTVTPILIVLILSIPQGAVVEFPLNGRLTAVKDLFLCTLAFCSFPFWCPGHSNSSLSTFCSLHIWIHHHQFYFQELSDIELHRLPITHHVYRPPPPCSSCS